jgi:hypothetical protein
MGARISQYFVPALRCAPLGICSIHERSRIVLDDRLYNAGRVFQHACGLQSLIELGDVKPTLR